MDMDIGVGIGVETKTKSVFIVLFFIFGVANQAYVQGRLRLICIMPYQHYFIYYLKCRLNFNFHIFSRYQISILSVNLILSANIISMPNTYQQIQPTLNNCQFTLQIQHSCYYQFRQVYTMDNPLLAPNSTTTPTSNSSFDHRSSKNNHIFDWLNIKQTLIVMRDIVVIPTKIDTHQHQINVTTHMTRQNGSTFLIPSNYLTIFNFNNKCSENTQYQIREFRDCFTVDLLVKFQKTDVSAEAQARIQANIEKAIQNYRKFLSILGYVQIGSSDSYKLKYLITKLKKQIITSVKLKRVNSSQDPLSSDHAQESNVNKVSEIAIKNFHSPGNEDCPKARNFKRGGYFNIDKKQCRITLCDGSEIDKTVALKKVRKVVHKQQNKQSQQQSKEKLEYQLRIISKLKRSKYLINYYSPPQDFFFAMQFIEKSLKDVIYAKDVLNVKQILLLSKQLISGVQYIHKMGVIHRDLKPDNILIAKTQDSMMQLKIIDFGQSVIIDENQTDKQKRRFGCTPPYSPIQCVIDCMDGINKKEIDFWSVSMIIYELSFRERPLYYNKAICQTILQEQPEYFDYRPVLSHRPLQGIRKIEQLTYLLTEQNLRLAQDERLPLSTLYQCINSMQNFYDQVIKKFQAS